MLIAITGFTVATRAQVSVSINIGSQPAWGPVGYDYVDYYYLPDIQTYYYVPERVYIYRNGNAWKRSRSLPSRYASYNVYTGHKVVINNVDRPYLHHDRYMNEYSGFRGKHDQVSIRDSKEEKYFVNRGHPQHGQWKKDHGNNGNHGNKGKGGKKNRDR